MARQAMRRTPTIFRAKFARPATFATALASAAIGGCVSTDSATLSPHANLSRPVATTVPNPTDQQGRDFSWQEAFSKAESEPAVSLKARTVGFRVDENLNAEGMTLPHAAAGSPGDSGEPGDSGDSGDSEEDGAVQGGDIELDAHPADSVHAKSVDQYVGMALGNHPSVVAARQRVSAELHRIPQARALPNPVFNNTFWPVQDQSLQTAAGRVANQMSISQSVPWPEKLRTKAAIVSREVQIAAAEVDRIEREITESVRLAYYEIWFSSQAIAIVDETQNLVSDLTKVAEAKYRSGGTQQDVLRARLENDRLENQRIGLQKQKQMAQADLAALLQQPVTLEAETQADLGLVDVPARLDELVDAAERCNPELVGLAWEVQRDRQKQKLACLEKYPDLQFGLNWGLVSDGRRVVSPVANGADLISFNVGTTLPIWREKIDAGIRETSNRTSSSAKRLEAKRDALYGKLRRLLAQANAFTEQRDVYRDRIIPRTEDTLKLSIADYRGKRTDFFTVIETYRELLMFETQVARIEASLAGTIAQIDRAVGCP